MAEVWLRLAGARIRSDAEYRASFSMVIVAVFLMSFLDFVAVMLIFTNVPALTGWSFLEVAVLYGTSGVSFNAANVLMAGVDRAAEHIRAGTFDTLLLRPVGTITQLSAGDIEPKRLGRLAQATIVLAVALVRVPVDWTPARVVAVPLILVAGAVIFSAIWVAMAAVAFWTVENRAIANSVTYGGNYITIYPFDVFGGWLRAVIAIVPLAFVNYLPVARLLGKEDTYGWPSWVGLVSPIVAVVTALGARAVWRVALRRYRSTGT